MVDLMAMNLHTERLRPLPSKPDETWQGGLVRIPGKVVDDDGSVIEPAGFLWMSMATGRVHMGRPGPASDVTPAAVVAALVEFAVAERYRPGRLEVADAAQAAALVDVVGSLGIAVDVVDALPGVAFMADHLAKSLAGGQGDVEPPEPLTDDPAITPDRLRAFAEGAVAFHAAAAWQWFGPTDLVRVASPTVARPLRFFNVMGGGGEQFGLAFFASRPLFEAMVNAADPGDYADKHPMVSVTFDEADMLPAGDVAAWKAHRLPTVQRGRKVLYPLPITFNRGVWLRPTAAELAAMEGLLRAVAATRPADLEAGSWSAEVTTADGPVAYTFELLSVGKPKVAFDPFAPFAGLAEPPATEAERLIDQASRVGGRPAADLARRALALDPDSVDALAILGDTAPNAAAAVDFYRQGVAAGERALGPKFAELTGHFWGAHETRPYMRAMAGLANALRSTGRLDEAVDVWRRMLELNPNDNQGVRDLLSAVLLQLGRDAELSTLLAHYSHDAGVVHHYAATLLKFRAEGDTPAAVKSLAEAVAANPHMVAYLTGTKRPPKRLPATYSPGQPTEAEAFANDLLPGWTTTPGAIEWLRSHVGVAKAKRAPSKRRKPS